MHNCKSSEELRQAIMNEMQSTMTELRGMSESINEVNIANYYGDGDPKYYKRTGTLPNATYTTPLRRLGQYSMIFSLQLDENRVNWSTGTFTPAEVLMATEGHTSGVLGRSHYFEKTTQQTEELTNHLFASKFK